MSTQSHACCTVPAAIPKDKYTPKGTYSTLSSTKTYVTGPTAAKKGLLYIYDIFGFFPQTLQGADILATGDSENGPYRVLIPDLFDGEPADVSWYPPKTDEQKEKLGKFFETRAGPPGHLERIPKIVEAAKKEFGIETWAVVGFCWGGKIATLLSQESSIFKAAASCHPAMVDPADAPKITIPFAMLPSGDEDKDAYTKHKEALTVANILEPFPSQVHGWMAARAELEDENVKKEYERGYKTLLDFFHDHV